MAANILICLETNKMLNFEKILQKILKENDKKDKMYSAKNTEDNAVNEIVPMVLKTLQEQDDNSETDVQKWLNEDHNLAGNEVLNDKENNVSNKLFKVIKLQPNNLKKTLYWKILSVIVLPYLTPRG